MLSLRASYDCLMITCLLTEQQQAEQLEAEKERAVEREDLLSQVRERCAGLESQSRDVVSEGESFAQLKERYVQLEMQTKEHNAEMEEALTLLQNRCVELEQLQEQDPGLMERERLLELQQQFVDLKTLSNEQEMEIEEKLAGLQERCAMLETHSKDWMEERELFAHLKVQHEELESEQEQTQEMLEEIEEKCMELENENRDLEEELAVTKEQLQQAREVSILYYCISLITSRPQIGHLVNPCLKG